MYRKIFITLLAIILSICAGLLIVSCSGESETYSTIEMEEGIVYLTNFSVRYTSEEESPYGEVDESTLAEEKSGTVQSYYMVMQFDMQTASNIADMEYLTVEFTVLDADIADATVNYANTSSTEVKISDRQTTITATYSLPDKAKLIKNVYIVIELKPMSKGGTDIYYTITSDDKEVSDYEDKDTTVIVESNYITITKDTDFEYTCYSDSCCIAGIGSKYGAVHVRDTYNSLPVTRIASKAFYECASLTSIVIPDSIKVIGSYAFYKCTSLKSVVISESVYILNEYTFYSCYYLESLYLPASVQYIEEKVFTDCSSLDGVYITDLEAWCNITYSDLIRSNPMYYADHLYLNGEILSGEVVLPDGITSVPYGTFKNSNVTSVVVPNSVTEISRDTFYGCSCLESITLPFVGSKATVDTSENNSLYMFGYIFGSTEYDGSVLAYQRYMDYNSNYGMHYGTYTTYYLPETLTTVTITGGSICYGAFSGCNTLTDIIIQNKKTSLNNYVFYGCSSLKNVVMPSNLKSIGEYTFGECDALTSIVIPDSVTSIGDYAFYWSESLSEVTIGSGVTSIGINAFYRCSSLESVTFENTSGWYVSTSSSATSGTNVDVNDAKQNATYLTSTYREYYWFRRES